MITTGLSKALASPIQTSNIDPRLSRQEESMASSSSFSTDRSSGSDQITINLDEEGAVYRRFESAYEARNVEEQIITLEQLGELCVRKGDYIRAAHLFNAAAALSKEGDERLLNRLLRLEIQFINNVLGQEGHLVDSKFPPFERREVLKNIRKSAFSMLEESKLCPKGVDYWVENQGEVDHHIFAPQVADMSSVQNFLTEGYKSLLCRLIEEAIDLFGKRPPCRYAVIGLGSMARVEMCPYSDIEFAFLIEENSEEYLFYFRQLSKLITLMMINIGETRCELVRYKRKGEVERPATSLTITGYSMDIGGLCPSGKEGVYELIGTPEALSYFQTEEWNKEHDCEIILVNAMASVCLLTGDARLVEEYGEKITAILNRRCRSSSSSKTIPLRQKRALELMVGALEEFRPKLNEEKIAIQAFDVKRELYRLPQTVITSLARYFGIESSSTIEAIEELRKRGLLSVRSALRLKNVLQEVFQLRFLTHFFYRTEKEILYNPVDDSDLSSKELYVIDKKMRALLLSIYRTLIPLHRYATEFFKGNREVFSSTDLWDETVGKVSYADRDNLGFSATIEKGQELLSIAPNVPEFRQFFAEAQIDLGKGGEAIPHLHIVLSQLTKKYDGKPNQEIAITFLNLGKAYLMNGEYREAIKYFVDGLKLSEDLSLFRLSADFLDSLADIYSEMGAFEEALSYANRSMAVRQALQKDDPNLSLHHAYKIMGRVHTRLGNGSEALFNYRKSLEELERRASGSADDKVALAEVLNGIANASLLCNSNQDAAIYYEKALIVMKELYGSNRHPDIAGNLSNLGLVYHQMGQTRKGLSKLIEAAQIQEELFPSKAHPTIYHTAAIIGKIYKEGGDLEQAIQWLRTAIRCKIELLGNDLDRETAQTAITLGNVFILVSDWVSAHKNFEIAFLILSEVSRSPDEDEDLAEAALNFANSLMEMDQVEEAIQKYKLSLEIYRKIHKTKPMFDKIALVSLNFGTVYSSRGERDKAIVLFQDAYNLLMMCYGPGGNLEAAGALLNLGISHFRLGKIQEAADYYQRAYEMFLRTGGADHPYTQAAKQHLEGLERSLRSQKVRNDHLSSEDEGEPLLRRGSSRSPSCCDSCSIL